MVQSKVDEVGWGRTDKSKIFAFKLQKITDSDRVE
jgi:hypothetical protein